MARILFGIPMYKPHRCFLESLHRFVTLAVLSHDIEVYVVRGKSLVDAQNDIAEHFLNSDYDYLLLLENDHSEHTLDMLNALLKPNLPVVAIKYYKRHYPFNCCLFDGKSSKSGIEYKEFPVHTKGYKECVLVHLGMTLIRKDTFNYLEKPYFRLSIEEGQENKFYPDGRVNKSIATDRNFCSRLIEKGIKPIGCFDYTLTHCGINEDTLWDYRSYGLKLFRDWKGIFRFFRSRGKSYKTFAEYWKAENERNTYISRYSPLGI